MQNVRAKLGVPAGRPLHWKDHVKVFPRRQYVASVLSTVPGLQVVYVVIEKIATTTHLQNNQARFYNYAAGLILERAVLAGRDWPGGTRDVVVRFGHVRGFDHRSTASYFRLKQAQAPPWVPYHLLRRSPTFDGQAKWDGLQAADAYAGMLHAALVADPYGGYESQHLLAVRHQLRRGPSGKVDGFGLKAWVSPGALDTLPWWPAGGL